MKSIRTTALISLRPGPGVPGSFAVATVEVWRDSYNGYAVDTHEEKENENKV